MSRAATGSAILAERVQACGTYIARRVAMFSIGVAIGCAWCLYDAWRAGAL
jgi:hypothetical protein